MGNCCLRRDSAAVWASEEDWVSVSQLHQNSQQPEKQKLLGEDQFRSSASLSCRRQSGGSSSGGDHQVKIKITKRELEELVGSRGGAGDVEQLLAGVINDRDDQVEEHHRPWRPALQTIPELN